MAAGLFGYLGYDMVRLMEELPPPNPDPIGIPDAIMIRPTVVVVFDAVKDTITVVTPVRPEAGVAAQGRAQRARPNGSPAIVDALDRPLDKEAAGIEAGPLDVPPDLEHHAGRISRDGARARRSTSRPATSSRWCCRSASRRRSRCRRSRSIARCGGSIRRRSCIFLDFGGFAVAGSSPEILVRVRDGTVTIRPIAGTRPRGETPHEDKALEDELLADPKERAEHLMLLDLGRNDVGRVAEIGSVKVTDQFFIERYSHVMHIVSNVEGELGATPRRGRRARGRLSRPARCPARRRCARWRSSTSWRRKSAGSMPAAVGYFSRRRRDGHLHRAAHRAGEGRHDVRAGRRRHRRRLRSGVRAAGMHQQGTALFRAAEEARRFASAAKRGQ